MNQKYIYRVHSQYAFYLLPVLHVLTDLSLCPIFFEQGMLEELEGDEEDD